MSRIGYPGLHFVLIQGIPGPILAGGGGGKHRVKVEAYWNGLGAA